MLGKGTYSKVYLGRNRQTDRKYAVKIVAKKDKNGSCTKNIVDE
jgi:serine/threonine protein kinase